MYISEFYDLSDCVLTINHELYDNFFCLMIRFWESDGDLFEVFLMCYYNVLYNIACAVLGPCPGPVMRGSRGQLAFLQKDIDN